VIFNGNARELTGRLVNIRIEDSTGYTLYGSPELE
jgi:hypothetical protein